MRRRMMHLVDCYLGKGRELTTLWTSYSLLSAKNLQALVIDRPNLS